MSFFVAYKYDIEMVRKGLQVEFSLMCLLLLGIAVGFISCAAPQGQEYQEEKVAADFIKIQSQRAKLEQRYPGTIEGIVNVDIKAQVSGYLETIYVKEGEYVQQGQALFRIKGDVFREQVNNTQATLRSALAAQASAKIEVEKIRPLVEAKVFTDFQLQTAQAQYDAATAQVAQAKAALGSAQLNADFAIIKATVSGFIGRIPNRIGNLVTPNDALPLTTLSEINQVFVYFSLSEADFIAYTKALKDEIAPQTVQIVLADGSVYPRKGRLEMASGHIDRNTGSIALKAVFDNPDQLLRAGGSVRVIMLQELQDVLTVPVASVKDIQDKFFVFSLADTNKIAMKEIEVNGRVGADYILKNGLNVGEKIALNSIDVLRDGMSVNVLSVQ